MAKYGLPLVAMMGLGGCALIAGLDFEDVPGGEGGEGVGGTAGASSVGGMGTGTGGAATGGGGGDPTSEPIFLIELGGPGDDHGRAVEVLSSGDLVIAGEFVQSLSLPGFSTMLMTAQSALFLVRIGAEDGMAAWGHLAEGTNIQVAGLARTPQSLHLAGTTGESLTPWGAMPEVVFPNANRQIFQISTDEDGGLEDLFAIHNPGNDVSHDIAAATAGDGFYVCGTFHDELRLDSDGPFIATDPATDEDAFVGYRLANGNTGWLNALRGAGEAAQRIQAVETVGDAVVIGGWILETSELVTAGQGMAPLPFTGPHATAFVMALDADTGAPETSLVFGGAGQQKLLDLARVDSNELIAVGTFKDEIVLPDTNGDPTTIAADGDAGFVIRITTNGRLEWYQRLTGVVGDYEITTVAMADGRVVVGGRYQGDGVQLGDVALPSSEGVDGFVAGLDGATGAVGWAHRFGAAGNDAVADVVIDAGHVVAIGTFSTAVEMGSHDIESPSSDGQDVFVVKFSIDQAP